MKAALCTLSLLALAGQVLGHGRLVQPPHRGWIGREANYKFIPIDYSDNGLNAGGIEKTRNGQHGVCGDPVSDPVPRAHENGGYYGFFPNVTSQAVAACYSPGQTVSITVHVTANHMGYFEFDVCKLNKKDDVETEACFQPLVQPTGQPRWPVPTGNDFFKMEYNLPKDLTCEGESHCVFRWHYTGSNNWVNGSNSNVWDQEHFWNCADIYISKNCGAPSPSTPSPSTTQPTTPKPTTPEPTQAPVTPAPTTTSPVTPPTTTPAPGDKCNGNHNVCYWPETNQVIPYSKENCQQFTTFVWCP